MPHAVTFDLNFNTNRTAPHFVVRQKLDGLNRRGNKSGGTVASKSGDTFRKNVGTFLRQEVGTLFEKKWGRFWIIKWGLFLNKKWGRFLNKKWGRAAWRGHLLCAGHNISQGRRACSAKWRRHAAPTAESIFTIFCTIFYTTSNRDLPHFGF